VSKLNTGDFEALQRENNIPETARYSLLRLGRGQMLDHIVVSRSLLGLFKGADIHNEALPDETGAPRGLTIALCTRARVRNMPSQEFSTSERTS